MKRIIAVTLTCLAVAGLARSSAQKQSLDGVWRSEGYGLVFEVQGTRKAKVFRGDRDDLHAWRCGPA
jgi:hypothetical protein